MAAASIIDHGARDCAALRLALTGAAPAVCRADAPRVPLARARCRAARDARASKAPMSRQRLLQLLWPDDDPENARNVLRQRLFRLRRAVGADVVVGAERLSLAAGATHDVDGDADALLAAHDYAALPRLRELARRAAPRDRARRRAARSPSASTPASATAAMPKARRSPSGSSPPMPLDEAAVQRLMKLRYLDGQRAGGDRRVRALRERAARRPRRRAVARDASSCWRRSAPRASRCRGAPRHPGQRAAPAAAGRPRRRAPSAARGLVGRARVLAARRGRPGQDAADRRVRRRGVRRERRGRRALVVPARPGDAGVPYASLGRALRALIERRPMLLEQRASAASWRA